MRFAENKSAVTLLPRIPTAYPAASSHLATEMARNESVLN
jgi:hypothetical protein